MIIPSGSLSICACGQDTAPTLNFATFQLPTLLMNQAARSQDGSLPALSCSQMNRTLLPRPVLLSGLNFLARSHPIHLLISRFVTSMRSSKLFKFGNPTFSTILQATRLISHYLIGSSKGDGFASPCWERRHPCRPRG